MAVTALVNIGQLFTGDLDRPLLHADSVVIENGLITHIGDAPPDDADTYIDVAGMAIMPGLIDNHVHPVFGDYTPRSSTSGFLEGFVHGGVTSIVSAGEVHTPGRPRDRDGTKALAVLAHKAWSTLRPGGLRVHAGALLLEEGLTEADFAELAALGVHLVGEIGISGVQDESTAAEMTRWAQRAGMTVMVHVGGKSVPTSRSIDGAFCVAVQPDVAGHVNGGPTAVASDDVAIILDETNASVELVYNGNARAARDAATLIAERGHLDRLVLGTDSPAGQGIAPGGILRLISLLCSMTDLAPGDAIASATGNTARARRIPGGLLTPGAVGDLVIADAPEGSQATNLESALRHGDTPAVACVVIDGEVRLTQSRNTAPPQRTVKTGVPAA